MQKLFILLLLIIAVSSTAFSQNNTITTDSVLQTGPCAGSQVIVRFSTTGTFPKTGNKFTAQLSNAWGQFTNPVNIGSSTFNLGFIMATLPANATFGFLYRIRVVSSNPAVEGTPSPNTVIITSNSFTATITPPQGGTTICPGDTKTLQVAIPAENYLWSTGETTQSIKVKEPGSYWVKVTDITTCESRDTIEITPAVNCAPLSVSGRLQQSAFKAYPNPVSAKGILMLDGLESDWDEILCIDIVGRIQAKIPSSSGSAVSLSSYRLAEGMYQLVVLKHGEIKANRRLVVIK